MNRDWRQARSRYTEPPHARGDEPLDVFSSYRAFPRSLGREIRSSYAGEVPSEIGAFFSGIGDIPSGYVAFCSGIGDIASGCVAFCSGIGDIPSGYVAICSGIGDIPSGYVAICSGIGDIPSGCVAFFFGIDAMGLGEAQSSQKIDLLRFNLAFSGSGKGLKGILGEGIRGIFGEGRSVSRHSQSAGIGSLDFSRKRGSLNYDLKRIKVFAKDERTRRPKPEMTRIKRKDAELSAQLTAFQEAMNPSISSAAGLSAAELTALSDGATAFQTGLATVASTRAAARAAVQGKDENKELARDAFQVIVDKIYATPSITNEILASLSLPPRAGQSVPTLPSIVTNLTGVANADGTARLRWNRNGNPTSTVFLIEASTNNGPFVQIAQTLRTRFIDPAATPGVEKTYRVVASNGLGQAPASSATTIYATGGEGALRLAA